MGKDEATASEETVAISPPQTGVQHSMKHTLSVPIARDWNSATTPRHFRSVEFKTFPDLVRYLSAHRQPKFTADASWLTDKERKDGKVKHRGLWLTAKLAEGVCGQVGDGRCVKSLGEKRLHRLNESLVSRSCLQLDADFAFDGFVQHVKQTLGPIPFAVWPSASHDPAAGKWKYRVLVELPRRVDGAEFTKVTTAVCHALGAHYFDPVCRRPAQGSYAIPAGVQVLQHPEGDRRAWAGLLERGKAVEQRWVVHEETDFLQLGRDVVKDHPEGYLRALVRHWGRLLSEAGSGEGHTTWHQVNLEYGNWEQVLSEYGLDEWADELLDDAVREHFEWGPTTEQTRDAARAVGAKTPNTLRRPTINELIERAGL